MEMTRKDRRKGISPVRLHSKAFEKEKLVETILGDGSIQFDIEGFASTVDKDYDGDIITTDAFDLNRFMKNPVMKAQHGRWLWSNIWIVKDIEIIADEWMYIKWSIILSPDIESHKEIIHWLRHWLIKGFSIWFGKIKMKWDEEKKANIITSLELHEISLVDIPNNPSTVRKMLEIVKDLDADWDGYLSLYTDDEETLNESDAEDETSEDENEIGDDEMIDEVATWGEDINDESTDDTSDNDGDDTKSIITSEDIKAMILPAGELPTIGWMYRIKFIEQYERYDEVYQYENIYNCECIKISKETEEDESVKHEIYWLIYTLKFEWWEPTTYVVKSYLSETQIMELSEEQLKELGSILTKEVAQDNINPEADADDWQQWVEELNNTDWQDNAEIWNEEGDQEETPEIEPVKDEGGDDLEIVSWNADDGWDESQKELKIDEVKALETKVNDLTKSLDEANELIENQKALIESKDQIIAEKEAGEEEVAKTLEAIAEENIKLKSLIEKVNNNYKELGKLYDWTVEEVKQHPLQSRIKFA